MNDVVANLHLIRPLILLLVPVAVAVWWIWRRSSEPLQPWRSQMDPELLNALSIRSGNGRDWRYWGVLGVWLVAIVAADGPTWKPEPSPFAESQPPLMVLLKTAPSMESDLVSPTRLERAKLKIADLARLRPGEPLGLVVYSGSAHLVLPPTKDTAVVADMANQVSAGIMPAPGDRLELALAEASRALGEQSAGATLLVLADSVESAGPVLASAQNEARMGAIQFLAMSDPGSSARANP